MINLIESQYLLTEESILESQLSVLLITNKNENHILEYIQAMGINAEIYELNPEEIPNGFTTPVLVKAVNYAMEQEFNMAIAIDSDISKITVAIRKHPKGEFEILNVHQLGVLLTDLIINSKGIEDGIFYKSYRITSMIERMVTKNNGRCVNFFPDDSVNRTNIGEDVLMHVNDNHEFYMEGEEPFLQILGFLLREEVKLRESQKTLFDKLIDLYKSYGFYKEKMLSVTIREKSQFKHYSQLMESMRRNTPSALNNCEVRLLIDFKKSRSKNLMSGKTTKIDAPSYNGIMLVLLDGSTIIMELTLDKMNYYISLRSLLHDKQKYDEVGNNCNKQILKIVETLNMNISV